VRVYTCPNCQFELDRDLKASINMLKQALHLAQQAASA
jgi:transposase